MKNILNGWIIGAIACAVIICVALISGSNEGHLAFQDSMFYSMFVGIAMIVFLVKGTSTNNKNDNK